MLLHVVGASGTGMNPLTKILSCFCEVYASDKHNTKNLVELSKYGVTVNSPEKWVDCDVLVASTAIPDNHFLRIEAERRNIPVWSRSEALKYVTGKFDMTVAVAGTHGKTTVTTMISHIYNETAGASWLIGADNPLGNANFHSTKTFICEADESDGTFLNMKASHGIITNIEPDHLTHWGSFANLLDGFKNFIENKSMIIYGDSEQTKLLANKTGIVTYGFQQHNDYIIESESMPTGQHITIIYNKTKITFMLPSYGKHNALNACAAFAHAIQVGIPPDKVIKALESFTGVDRRFQIAGKTRNNVTVIEDFAHLPSEIATTIETAKQFNQRIITVFQPHRYTRTQKIAEQFTDCFNETNILYITDIYSAGEQPIPNVTSQLISDNTLKPHILTGDLQQTQQKLEETLQPQDICLLIGAGNINDLTQKLLS